MSQFAMLPLDHLVESTTNPRRTFDAAKLAELADSIRAQGVIQPILVRPQLKGADDEHYEIVAGHRRFRAAQMAGVAEIPALVRPLTDLEVLEIQLLENLQRDDLTALDEAKGYRALADQHGMSAESIARKIGKSREYVFARMKLLNLGDEGRAALEDGRLSPSVALLVARLPKVIQGDAVERVLPAWKPDGLSAREAADVIRSQFTMPIKKAPFDATAKYFHAAPKELTLIAPPCAECDKRTKCAEDLFSADPKAPDMCMDRECYDAKTAAERREKIRRARAEGVKVIEGKEAEKLLKNGAWNIPGYYVDHGRADLGGEWNNVSDLVKACGEHAPRAELIIDPDDDEVLTVYPQKALRDALSRAGWFDRKKDSDPKTGSAGGGSKAAAKKEDPKAKAAREAAEESRAVRMEILRAVRAHMKVEIAAHGGLPWEDTVRRLLAAAYESLACGDGSDLLMELCSATDWRSMVDMAKNPDMPLPDLFLLCWTALLADRFDFVPQDREQDDLLTTADRLGVDAIAIETSVKLARRAEKTEEETPPAAMAAPKKAGRKKLKDLDQGELEAAATGVSGDLELEGGHA